MKVAGLILAAGGSSRMGDENKLMMPYDGMPMVNHVVNAAVGSNLDHTFMVLGNEPSAIKKMIQNDQVQFVENKAWKAGMASSIAAGVHELTEFDGYLILLGDMPLVTFELINKLINHAAKNKIVVPVNKGRQGNPVLFGANFRDELMNLKGDVGAKGVIRNNVSSVVEIEVDSDAIFQDFDTQESLKVGVGAA